jgi:multiple sugar transport system ATP-binding protein
MPFPELAVDGTAEVILGVRPEHIKLVPSDQEGHEALVDLVESTGPEDNVTLSVNGQKVTARLETGVTKSGQTVKVQIATDKVSLFDAASGKRIN